MARRDVLAEALALPLEDRARIVRELLRSLEGDERDLEPEAIERAWTEELSRRLDDLDAGSAAVEEWPTVRDELRATLRRRRAAP